MSRRTNVLVLRTDDGFSYRLRSAGIAVTNLPLIKTEPLEDRCRLRRAILRIDEFDGLFFTSGMAAEIFAKEMEGRTMAYSGKLYVMGERSRDILEAAGFRTEFDEAVNTAEELIESRGNEEFAGKKLLFVRGNRSMRTIPHLLAEKAIVEEVVVYRTVSCRPDMAEIDRTAESLTGGEIDWLCFFSPSAVGIFRELFGTGAEVKTAAIGRTTANRAADAGFNVGFVSPRSSAVDFATAFISHLDGK